MNELPTADNIEDYLAYHLGKTKISFNEKRPFSFKKLKLTKTRENY